MTIHREHRISRLDAAANGIPAPSLILTQDPYAGGASQLQAQSFDYNPCFWVTIYGPGHDKNAQFMTRKKHTIKKVLAGACKSFGFDPTRAKLQQILVVADEITGELVLHFYDCDNSETVGKAGIKSDSNLRVVLEGKSLVLKRRTSGTSFLDVGWTTSAMQHTLILHLF
ncbi:hypothetical protein GYMLUDRAFT_63106 [Collybiopsis luxurians FD-317 M1]|uniref:Uncharacterized protein n=1 Tax=Collybiopsis luxurians FD-317 M1 TaxID=944289 RepID=A0A0D0BXK8_9AGAR|nr:hypothetical protein GYMLUDRAFT_63106 [Collybiopsis luxurians FD-317 M1]